MTPPIAMLNPETAAPILDCSPDTVAELLNTGELPGLRYGRSWIIPPAALEQCLTSRAIEQMLARHAGPHRRRPAPTVAAQGTAPKIGDAWPEHGGIYAGISRGEDGAADAHIVLLEATPEDGMTWADAVKWAKSLGDGARLPTRFESALLYANLRDKLDTDNWHWTGTQYSDNDAWFQYFDNGSQYYYFKGAKARARAVRRFVL